MILIWRGYGGLEGTDFSIISTLGDCGGLILDNFYLMRVW